VSHFLPSFLTSNQAETYPQLRCCVMPGKYFGYENLGLYSSLYSFWHQQWSETFSEIGIPFDQMSEEFCRHEEIVGLLYDDKIAAVVLLDCFNPSSIVHQKHRYFVHYPSWVVEKIQSISQGRPVLTAGYLAVDPAFRGCSLSDVVLGLGVMRLKESPCDVMITYTRNARGTNQLTYRVGGQAIVQNQMVRGEPSDFVYFDESSPLVLEKNSVYGVIQDLWNRKIYIPSSNLQSLKQPSVKGTLNDIRYNRSL